MEQYTTSIKVPQELLSQQNLHVDSKAFCGCFVRKGFFSKDRDTKDGSKCLFRLYVHIMTGLCGYSHLVGNYGPNTRAFLAQSLLYIKNDAFGEQILNRFDPIQKTFKTQQWYLAAWRFVLYQRYAGEHQPKCLIVQWTN